jgi:MFS family permease
MIPVSIVMFFMSGQFGELSAKYGPRLFMTCGPALAAVGFLTMLRMGKEVHYIVDLLPGLLLFALGLSMTVAPLTSAVLESVDPKRAGIASAVNNAVARIAGLLAIAFVGVIGGKSITIYSFHHVLVAIASLLLLGSIISGVSIKNIPRSRTVESPLT